MGRGFDFGYWKPKHGHLKTNFLPPVQFSEVGFNVFPGEKLNISLKNIKLKKSTCL